jgi:hypothetical protein
MRVWIPLSALTLALGLACASGSDDAFDTGTVASSTTGDGDCTSNISGIRDPEPAVEVAKYHLSGSAWLDDAGALRVTLNPIVNADTGNTQAPTADELTVTEGQRAIAVTSVEAVEQGDALPVDIVFLLDTTGSMSWAIDGVKQGIRQFLDVVGRSGLDARVGGWEFGDFPRTSIAPTDVTAFEAWVDDLRATGGGDLPENPLDTIAAAYDDFAFRKGAMRYFVVVTDVGMHEAGPGAACTAHTLSDVLALSRGQVLYGVLMADLGLGDSGVPVRWITDAAGGLYVRYDVSEVLVSFDISADTPLDELLEETRVIVADGTDVEVGDTVTITWNNAGESWTVDLPVQ